MDPLEPTAAGISPLPAPGAPQGPADFPAALKRGQSLELKISDLAYGGKALAKVQGLVVFVENALPGDRVLATITRKRRQYAEARADRVQPRIATQQEPGRRQHDERERDLRGDERATHALSSAAGGSSAPHTLDS